MNKNQSIVLPGLLALSSVAFAQSIPAPAKATLARLYPAATQVKWDKEDRDYEASFKNKGQAMSLVLDAKGMLKETETSIAPTALPTRIRRYMAQKKPGKPISEAAIIISADGTRTYEAAVNGTDYLFDATGTLLKK